MESRTHDAIIIGSGQGGNPLASAFARAGRKTALVERENAGGTCINTGCTPTKTLIASARVAHVARRGGEYGVHTAPVRVDMERVRRRADDIVLSFRASTERQLETAGVERVRGEARFVDAHTIEVKLSSGGTRRMSAGIIVIDAGTRPAVPPIPGLDSVHWLDSTAMLELKTLPSHLVVLGGGYVGLEFAQMFRRFGSQVTVIEATAQLLAREDPEVSAAVTDILREDGVDVLLDTRVAAAERGQHGAVRLRLEMQTGPAERECTHLLVATGRVPNSDALGLDAAGVETDARGFIRVNERLETRMPGIYAIGDVKGGPQFTHISYDDYRILRANLLDGAQATVTGRIVPYTVFIDPQLGRAGPTETDARAAGLDVRVARLPMAHVARAIEIGETRGFIKAVVDARSDRILGCAVLAVEGGELMGVLQVAIMAGLPYPVLRDGIFAHPTLTEALNNLFRDAAFAEAGVSRAG